MSVSSANCQICSDQKVAHPCWKHAKKLSDCRIIPHKWAPSRCRDCIIAAARMTAGGSQERTKAVEAYKPFLSGLRAFIERVC